MLMRIVALTRPRRHPAPLRLVIPTSTRCCTPLEPPILSVFFAETYQGLLVLVLVVGLVVPVRFNDDWVWHLFALRRPYASGAKPIDSILMDLLVMGPSVGVLSGRVQTVVCCLCVETQLLFRVDRDSMRCWRGVSLNRWLATVSCYDTTQIICALAPHLLLTPLAWWILEWVISWVFLL